MSDAIDQKEDKPKSTYDNRKNLWMEFTIYVDMDFGGKIFPVPMCGLCGNQGIVDTTEKAVTPGGQSCGGKFFCICPNGRQNRKMWRGSKYGKSSDITK